MKLRLAFFSYCIFIFSSCFSQVIDSFPNDSLARNEKLNFLPIPIIMNSPETSFGFGGGGIFTFKASKKDTSLRTSSADIVALYTLNQQLVFASEGSLYLPKENYIIKYQASFSKYPDLFWGIGNNTPASNQESYSYTQAYFHPEIVRKVLSKFFLGLNYEIQHVLKVDRNANDLFDQENVTGRNGGPISGIGITAAWDKRNRAFSPDKGEFVQFYARHYNHLLGSDFEFSDFSVDARKYFKTFHRQVLVFQAISKMTKGSVPFRSLASLGGSSLMRGYYEGRFRDFNMFAFQAEYRVPLWRRFGMVIFTGIGEVSSALKYYCLNGIKYSYGGGLRYALKKKDRLNLRIDYGFGQDFRRDKGAYLLISEAF
ncbi:MAG TPA: BamA/TamA family outer membrane protein [Bacteroidia bacterium]